MIGEWSDIERKNIIDLVKQNEDLFILKGDKLYKLKNYYSAQHKI